MRILYTLGDPAGIGPNIILKYHQQERSVSKIHAENHHFPIVIGCPELLAERAQMLGLKTQFQIIDPNLDESKYTAYDKDLLRVIPVPLNEPCTAGKLSVKNASFVITCLDLASKLCLQNWAQAVVTGPIHKGVINQAGIPFLGHTEFFQAKSKAKSVLMFFDANIRLALVTSHCSLKEVPNWITASNLSKKILLLNQALIDYYGIAKPKIGVLGLNPHAGEQGYLGREEVEIMIPALETLRQEGIQVSDPIPADTAFIPAVYGQYDALLAMYHDQGLTGLKALAFSKAVNITYGLNFIRTSVDHGTALHLAHSDKVDVTSLQHAVMLARQFAERTSKASNETPGT